MAKASANFLEFVPSRAIEWKTEENGRVCLIKEKTQRQWLKKVIGRFGRSQFFHIHLDEMGSAAWLLIDGKATVYNICRSMEERFGTRVAPAVPRLSQFFAMLKRNDFIALRASPEGGDTANR